MKAFLFPKQVEEQKRPREKDPTTDPAIPTESAVARPIVSSKSSSKVSFMAAQTTSTGTQFVTQANQATSQTTTQLTAQANVQSSSPSSVSRSPLHSPTRSPGKALIHVSVSANRRHSRIHSAPEELQRSPKRGETPTTPSPGRSTPSALKSTPPSTPPSTPSSTAQSTPQSTPSSRALKRASTPASPFRHAMNGSGLNPAFLPPKQRLPVQQQTDVPTSETRISTKLNTAQHRAVVSAFSAYCESLQDQGRKITRQMKVNLELLWGDVRNPDNADWDCWQLDFTTFCLTYAPPPQDAVTNAGHVLAVIAAVRKISE